MSAAQFIYDFAQILGGQPHAGYIRTKVTVRGKTGVRNVPLVATRQALERYSRRWRVAGEPLWRGKKGALTGSGVLQLVRRLCRKADVEFKGVHAFRRAAAAQMKRLGMNDSDILEVMVRASERALLAFVSSSCPSCKELMPGLASPRAATPCPPPPAAAEAAEP